MTLLPAELPNQQQLSKTSLKIHQRMDLGVCKEQQMKIVLLLQQKGFK